MTDIHEEVVKTAKSNLLSATEKGNDSIKCVAKRAAAKAGDLLWPLENEEPFDLIYESVEQRTFHFSATQSLRPQESSQHPTSQWSARPSRRSDLINIRWWPFFGQSSALRLCSPSRASLRLPSPSEIIWPAQFRRCYPLKYRRESPNNNSVGISGNGWLLWENTDRLVEGTKRARIGHWWICRAWNEGPRTGKSTWDVHEITPEYQLTVWLFADEVLFLSYLSTRASFQWSYSSRGRASCDADYGRTPPGSPECRRGAPEAWGRGQDWAHSSRHG